MVLKEVLVGDIEKVFGRKRRIVFRKLYWFAFLQILSDITCYLGNYHGKVSFVTALGILQYLGIYGQNLFTHNIRHIQNRYIDTFLIA